MNKKITLLIAEDHVLVREALKLLVSEEPGFKVIAETGSGEEAVELASRLKPDVVILDINLTGMSGFDVAPLIKLHSPGSQILALSCFTHPTYSEQMIKSGASGYVTKSSPGHEMIKAITEINEGRQYVCEQMRDRGESKDSAIEPPAGINALSKKEIRLVEEFEKGRSSNEIAIIMNISKRTIELHRYKIMKKLNLENVAALANYINYYQLDLYERLAG